MAVMHLYIARGMPAGGLCAALPSDAREALLRADSIAEAPLGVPGRRVSPRVTVPLNALAPDGAIGAIPWPRGRTTPLASGASVAIRRDRFQYRKVSLPVGASLTWRFQDPGLHNVVLANGPLSVGAPAAVYRSPRSYTTRFPRPGRYQLFCQFHPLTMHEQVIVGG
jgi:plastocyanin